MAVIDTGHSPASVAHAQALLDLHSNRLRLDPLRRPFLLDGRWMRHVPAELLAQRLRVVRIHLHVELGARDGRSIWSHSGRVLAAQIITLNGEIWIVRSVIACQIAACVWIAKKCLYRIYADWPILHSCRTGDRVTVIVR